MSMTLEQLVGEIRAAMTADPTPAGKQEICKIVSKALLDQDFVATHLQDRKAGDDPREVLYEDPELGFCICGHVYSGSAHGAPHDHGSSWAIYGQATGVTEMTDWKIVDAGSADKPILVEQERTYTLNPGDCHFYDVGAVHSPSRDRPVKLIRIEGANLDHVQRSNIKAA